MNLVNVYLAYLVQKLLSIPLQPPNCGPASGPYQLLVEAAPTEPSQSLEGMAMFRKLRFQFIAITTLAITLTLVTLVGVINTVRTRRPARYSFDLRLTDGK